MRNSQLLRELSNKVEVIYSSRPRPKPKVSHDEVDEYLVTDGYYTFDFRRLKDAQDYAVALNLLNKDGMFEVSRIVGDKIQRWFGKINYQITMEGKEDGKVLKLVARHTAGPEKIVWTSQISNYTRSTEKESRIQEYYKWFKVCAK